MERRWAKRHYQVEKEEKSSRFSTTIWETYFIGKNHTEGIHDFTFSTATLNITERITF